MKLKNQLTKNLQILFLKIWEIFFLEGSTVSEQ